MHAGRPSGFSSTFKEWDVEALVDRWFFRPIAELLVRGLAPVRALRPNHLSVASVGAGIASGSCYASGAAIAGAVWLGLSVVLDAADGQLARRRGSACEIGKLFDNVCDPLKAVPVVLGIVIGMHRSGGWGDVPVPWGLPDLVAVWMLGCLVGILLPLQVMSRNAFVDRYDRIGKGRATGTMADLERVRGELASLMHMRGLWLDKALAACVLTVAGERSRPTPSVGAPDPRYLARMRPYIRGWTFFGGATQFAVLMIASLLGQPVLGMLYIAGASMLVYLPLLLASVRAHAAATRA